MWFTHVSSALVRVCLLLLISGTLPTAEAIDLAALAAHVPGAQMPPVLQTAVLQAVFDVGGHAMQQYPVMTAVVGTAVVAGAGFSGLSYWHGAEVSGLQSQHAEALKKWEREKESIESERDKYKKYYEDVTGQKDRCGVERVQQDVTIHGLQESTAQVVDHLQNANEELTADLSNNIREKTFILGHLQQCQPTESIGNDVETNNSASIVALNPVKCADPDQIKTLKEQKNYWVNKIGEKEIELLGVKAQMTGEITRRIKAEGELNTIKSQENVCLEKVQHTGEENARLRSEIARVNHHNQKLAKEKRDADARADHWLWWVFFLTFVLLILCMWTVHVCIKWWETKMIAIGVNQFWAPKYQSSQEFLGRGFCKTTPVPCQSTPESVEKPPKPSVSLTSVDWMVELSRTNALPSRKALILYAQTPLANKHATKFTFFDRVFWCLMIIIVFIFVVAGTCGEGLFEMMQERSLNQRPIQQQRLVNNSAACQRKSLVRKPIFGPLGRPTLRLLK